MIVKVESPRRLKRRVLGIRVGLVKTGPWFINIMNPHELANEKSVSITKERYGYLEASYWLIL